jgi:hypothetical protein
MGIGAEKQILPQPSSMTKNRCGWVGVVVGLGRVE